MTTTVDTPSIDYPGIEYYGTGTDATIYDVGGLMVIHHRSTDTCLTANTNFEVLDSAERAAELIDALDEGDWEPGIDSGDAGTVYMPTGERYVYADVHGNKIDLGEATVVAYYRDSELAYYHADQRGA